MVTLELTKIPAKILREKQKAVTHEELSSEGVRELIEGMHAMMVKANGIGLAANQVGHNLQLFIIDRKLAEENGVPDAFINPEITEYSHDTDEMEEGCLSIPEFYMPIRRAKKIKMKALDQQGRKVKFKARGFLARVLQHEVDHIQGMNIKDRMDSEKKTSL